MEPARPSAFTLFCMYYLGLTPEFSTRFYNSASVGRHFGVSSGDVDRWLEEYGIGAAVFPHTSFNVAQAYGRAQELALTASVEEAKAFAETAFEEARQALRKYDGSRYRADVDYDDKWFDGE